MRRLILGMARSMTLASGLALVCPSVGAAQSCGDDPARTATERLDRARAALRADEANAPCEVGSDARDLDPACVERLEPVITDLELSIACAPSLAAHNNLAVALRRQGRVLRALALFEAILAGEHGALSAAQRASIEEQVARARGDLAMIEVSTHLADGPTAAEVLVDGRPAGATTEGEPVLRVVVDPGLRALEARAAGAATLAPIEIPIRRGDVREIDLALEPRTIEESEDEVEAAIGGATTPPGDDTGLIVGITLGAVVAVAAGVVIAVVLAQPQLPGPIVSVPTEITSP